MICVICPNGCQLQVDVDEGEKSAVADVRGSLCNKGPEWARQEIFNPVRTIASSILVEGGDFPVVSVRTDSPVPLKKINDVMNEIRTVRLKAPVSIGQVIIKKVLGLNCNIIATRNVQKS